MTYSIPLTVPAQVFRTYDIRGPVAEDAITADLAYAIGRVFGSMVLECGESCAIVGRDGRLTGLQMHTALIAGLTASGCDVIDLGLVASPMLYFATHTLSAGSGIMITASHNPAGDNGFKLVLAKNTLNTQGVQDIYQRIVARDFATGEGTVSQHDIHPEYVQAVISNNSLARPLKVVVDYGNGVGAVAGPEVFEKIGCEVIALYDEVDGNFPNHHPDPTVVDNLQDLIQAVVTHKPDIGLAFDGDADRIGVVTDQGEIIWPDRQLMLFAIDVLSRYPGGDIIFDVKCTGDLAPQITQHGGKPLMYKTGHSLIKAKMKEMNAPLAGEMSGHIFFNDEWFGFDDGVYVACRLLRLLAGQGLASSELFATLPNSVNTPELKLYLAEEEKAAFMQELIKTEFKNATCITVDGLRVEYDYGFALVRPSNTSSCLTLRFEADTQSHLDDIQSTMKAALLAVKQEAELPF